MEQLKQLRLHALQQSGVSQIEHLTVAFSGYRDSIALDLDFHEPLQLEQANPVESVPLFNWNSLQMEAISLSVLHDDAGHNGLLLMTRAINGNEERTDLNPGVSTWYVNGERLVPQHMYLFGAGGIPCGFTDVRCFYIDLPDDMTQIDQLQLFCVLNNTWPNETMAEIVLAEPVQLDQTVTIPVTELTVVPATF